MSAVFLNPIRLVARVAHCCAQIVWNARRNAASIRAIDSSKCPSGWFVRVMCGNSLTQIGHQTLGRLPACVMQHASGLAEGVAGKMPESLIFSIRNGHGVSDGLFGFIGKNPVCMDRKQAQELACEAPEPDCTRGMNHPARRLPLPLGIILPVRGPKPGL